MLVASGDRITRRSRRIVNSGTLDVEWREGCPGVIFGGHADNVLCGLRGDTEGTRIEAVSQACDSHRESTFLEPIDVDRFIIGDTSIRAGITHSNYTLRAPILRVPLSLSRSATIACATANPFGPAPSTR